MRKLLTATQLTLSLVAMSLGTAALADNNSGMLTGSNLRSTEAAILANNPSLNATALDYALKGYVYAEQQGKVKNPRYLTVINFDEPDTAKRLHVIDLNTDQVVLSAHVAQGKGSGDGTYATHFSNTPNTDATSLGAYVTGQIYDGEHGRSEHVIGLEKGINSNAVERDIEIHKANYVTSEGAGHSWGCFAVSNKKINKLINLVNGGSVIFAYATPEKSDTNLSAA